jgi:hypothetical protein
LSPVTSFVSLKTKIGIANIIGIISFVIGMVLLPFTPLACIFMLIGAGCLYLVGKWKKQEKTEMEKQGISVPVPSAQAIKRNLLVVIIGIGIILMITTPLFLSFSPGLREEAAAFIVGIVVSYAFIVFVLWRKRRPSNR